MDTVSPAKLSRALRQYAAEQKLNVDEQTLQPIIDIILQCGESTQVRKMALVVGRALLDSGMRATIVAPCCPDYSHRNGSYDFKDLHGGVPLLAQLQIAFLDRLVAIAPSLKVIMLLADTEANDQLICRKTRKSSDEIMSLVASSELAIKNAVLGRGWDVGKLSAIPLMEEVDEIARQLLEKYPIRLFDMSASRLPMYRLLDAHMSDSDAVLRTAKTAAQYLILGTFAISKGYLIANHSTVNLTWLRDIGAGVLHNDVRIY